MIIRLDPNDSSILTRIAQYSESDVPMEHLEKLLEVASPEAQEVGRLLLHQAVSSPDPDIVETANYFRDWATGNRAYSSSRSAAS